MGVRYHSKNAMKLVVTVAIAAAFATAQAIEIEVGLISRPPMFRVKLPLTASVALKLQPLAVT